MGPLWVLGWGEPAWWGGDAAGWGGEEGCSSPGQGLLACVEAHAAAVLAATLTSPCALGLAPKEVRLRPPIPALHPPSLQSGVQLSPPQGWLLALPGGCSVPAGDEEQDGEMGGEGGALEPHHGGGRCSKLTSLLPVPSSAGSAPLDSP